MFDLRNLAGDRGRRRRVNARHAVLGLIFVCAAGTASADVQFFSAASGYNDFFSFVNNYNPNVTTLAATSIGNTQETNNSSASLSAGTLKILNTGNVSTLTSVSTASFASMGDTITSSGATGGLKLGVSLAVDGSSITNHLGDNQTFLYIAAYAPGVFDSNAYYGGTALWYSDYVLGADSNTTSSLLGFYTNNSTPTAVYGDGSENISLSIPFSALPSTFDLYVALGSYEIGPGLVWSTDYSHTVSLSLAAPTGVTLTSASGVLPGTSSAVPEPGSVVLLGSALGALALWSRRK